jgi:copper chaperone CopZ
MFTKGSRYQNLDESSPANAAGERLRGKNLRYTPDTAGSYQHTVREGDRLDLLAYKYYGDATRWWLISDANPEQLFPTDLLDRAPVVRKSFSVVHSTFRQRLALLRQDLLASGNLVALEDLYADQSGGDFLQTTIAVEYQPSSDAHAFVLQELASEKINFHLLESRAWRSGVEPDANIIEAFTFDDANAVAKWHELIAELANLYGVLGVRSRVLAATLDVVYVEPKVSNAEIVKLIEDKGFVLAEVSALSSRVGARIVVPPNQIT